MGLSYIRYKKMKLVTTFWSKEVHEFDNLLYINGKTQAIIFQTNLGDVPGSVKFFKNIARFVKSASVRKALYSGKYESEVYYQFAVMKDGEMTPIKWFDLVINDKLTISHDIAFNTTLVKRNDVDMPFGRFPMYYYRRNINLPKYRELNVKARAYKFMGNQINK